MFIAVIALILSSLVLAPFALLAGDWLFRQKGKSMAVGLTAWTLVLAWVLA